MSLQRSATVEVRVTELRAAYAVVCSGLTGGVERGGLVVWAGNKWAGDGLSTMVGGAAGMVRREDTAHAAGCPFVS